MELVTQPEIAAIVDTAAAKFHALAEERLSGIIARMQKAAGEAQNLEAAAKAEKAQAEAATAAARAELAALEQRVQPLRAEKATLEAEVQELRAATTSHRNEIAAAKSRVAAL
jgi:predicted  nucleic acid-binding Zn-ribbon protein